MGPEAIHELESTPVPWRIAPYLGGGIVTRPVLGEGRLRWRRYTIDAADTPLPQRIDETLRTLEQVVNDAAGVHEFPLETGDWLLMDNQWVLHSRTAVTSSRGRSPRLMLRTWIKS